MDDDFQVMLSYRITEAGALELGGDGTVPRMKNWLTAQGFTVFVGESSLQGGQDWARTIQHAVEKCEVFVAICSPDYGNTTWTYRELSMADNKKGSAIVPVWHSGRFPPSHVEIILGATQRVPSGNKSLIQLDDGEWEQAMRQLVGAFKLRGCIPKNGYSVSSTSFDDYIPIWPNGERYVESCESPHASSPKSSPKTGLGLVSTPILSWGLLTSMTPALRQFLESEGLRLEVAVQLAEEWGVTTIDDLALIDEEDVSSLNLKVIDNKRLKGILTKARAPPPGDNSPPALPTSQSAPAVGSLVRPPSAGLQRKYLGAKPKAPAPAGTGARRTSSCVTSPANNRTVPADPPAPSSSVAAAAGKMRRLSVVSTSGPSASSPAIRRLTDTPLRRSSDYGGSGDLSGAFTPKRVTAVADKFTLKGHTGTIPCVTFSNDNAMVASGASQFDRCIKIWSVQHGELRADLLGHGSAILSVAFSPDMRVLASASKDKTVKLWDISTVMEGGRTGGYSEKLSAASTLSGHTAEVTGAAFTYDGKQLVSSSNDRNIKVWDAGTWSCTSTLTGHTKAVTTVITSHTDARTAVSGGTDGTVRVWDLRNGRCMRTMSGVHTGGSGVSSVALSSDGLHMLTCSSDDRIVRVHDMRAMGPGDARKLPGHTEGVTSVCTIPGQGCAASASHDKSVRIWDLTTGSCINTISCHSATVSCVAAMSDGVTMSTVASGSGDETIKLTVIGLTPA